MLRLVCIGACLSLLLPAAADGYVQIASNGRGDQLLFHRVLSQRTRPLFASARAPGTAFAALTPITSYGAYFNVQATVDDSGGSVTAWTTQDPNGGGLWATAVAVKPAGQPFGASLELSRDEPNLLQLAGNSHGDAIVAWTGYGYQRDVHYRFRPRDGDFGPPALVRDAGVGPTGLSVDEDGTAAYLFWKVGGAAGDPPTLRESRRPPGGDFGPASDVATFPPGATEFQMVTSRDGRALVVWVENGTVRAIERPPGGDFGAPFDVMTGVERYGNLRGIELADSGAAVVAFGYLDVGISVRLPGGKFGKRRSIGHVGSVGLALNARGDLAGTYESYDNRIDAIYMPAGKDLPKTLVLAAARPFDPHAAGTPGIAIDDSGRATVAWEESDGASVQTFTRDFDGSGAGARATVDSVPSFVREAPPEACRPAGAQLIATSRLSTVFFDSTGAQGCLLARGAPVRLSTAVEESAQHSGLALAGPLVAHANDYTGHSAFYTAMYVTDLRDEYSGVNRRIALSNGDTSAWVIETRLKQNAAVAWIHCVQTGRNGESIGQCRRVGGITKHVLAWDARANTPRLLDSGRRIDPRSFKLRGSRLSWRKRGKLRHATLR